jgi:cation diffusion facilitator CzcD-associated flavoprotein CzcO
MRARISGSPKVIIIGSGIGGLAMGFKLLRAGVRNFEIYEKSDAVGGTWRDNRYPGVACDIPSHLYTFTFFKNPGWTQLNAPGAEIQDYLQRLARRFGLYRHIRFGKEVVRCGYRDCQWQIETRDGEANTADAIVAATGFLHVPVLPDIAGMDTFAGALMHNSRWDPSVRIDGRRVAVIGTGSSGVQLVPAIVDRVRSLSIYQRTPQWLFPLPNEQYPLWQRFKRRLFPWIPGRIFDRYLQEFNTSLGHAVLGDTQKQKFFHDACEQNLATVRDPELRRKLTPDHPVLCKRLVFSAKFYEAVQKNHCELVTDPIASIEERGIRSIDGTLREADVIVVSTGFKTHEYCRSIGIHGEGGVSLDQAWSDGAVSFESAALAGFPNFFMVGGPHTTVGNLSYTTCAEMQASYIVQALRLRAERGARGIVPTEQAQQRFVSDMHAASGKTVWKSGCNSWYLDEHGQLDIWSKSVEDFIAMIEKGPQLPDFRLIR